MKKVITLIVEGTEEDLKKVTREVMLSSYEHIISSKVDIIEEPKTELNVLVFN